MGHMPHFWTSHNEFQWRKMSGEKVNTMKCLGAEILRTPTEALGSCIAFGHGACSNLWPFMMIWVGKIMMNRILEYIPCISTCIQNPVYIQCISTCIQCIYPGIYPIF